MQNFCLDSFFDVFICWLLSFACSLKAKEICMFGLSTNTHNSPTVTCLGDPKYGRNFFNY